MNQLALTFDRPAAIAAGELGMSIALQHADEVTPSWSEVVIEGIRLYAMTHKTFLAEDFRNWWGLRDGAMPCTHKAWGGVFAAAIKQRVIQPTGNYLRAKSVATHGHRVAEYQLYRGQS